MDHKKFESKNFSTVHAVTISIDFDLVDSQDMIILKDFNFLL